MCTSKPVSKAKTAVWQTTRVPNLLKHGPSGRYYARVQVSGKRKLLSLHTSVISVARQWPVKHLDLAHVDRLRPNTALADGFLTMTALYRTRFQNDSILSPATKASRDDAPPRLERFWPGWEKVKPPRITLDAGYDFSNHLHIGALHAAPKVRKRRKGCSSGTFNRTLDRRRRLLRIAQDLGAIYTNPFEQQNELRRRLKKMIVPHN